MSTKNPALIEKLLRRPDTWRGHSQVFNQHKHIDTGYTELNQQLKDKGWPEGCLIEVCERNGGESAWHLFHPSMQRILYGDNGLTPAEAHNYCDNKAYNRCNDKADNKAERNPYVQTDVYIALINPPALPFPQGVMQRGIALNNILIFTPQDKRAFIACFVELSLSSACHTVMAWQNNFALSYTELRKIHLATQSQYGLYLLFRPQRYQQHNSPASLRMLVTPLADGLEVEIFKQQGNLHGYTVKMPIPVYWSDQPDHCALGDENLMGQQQKRANASTSSQHEAVIRKQ